MDDAVPEPEKIAVDLNDPLALLTNVKPEDAAADTIPLASF